MSKRSTLKNEIRLLGEEIKYLELKRSRSCAAIVDCLISKENPTEEDINFFLTYTKEIEIKREQLQTLSVQLSKI